MNVEWKHSLVLGSSLAVERVLSIREPLGSGYQPEKKGEEEGEEEEEKAPNPPKHQEYKINLGVGGICYLK